MADLISHMQQTPIIPNSLAVWGLGQMGVAVKGPDGLIYIDACLSDVVASASRCLIAGHAPAMLRLSDFPAIALMCEPFPGRSSL